MSNGCKKAVPQQKLSASQRLCRAQSCGGAIRRNRRHRCLVASFGVLGLLVKPLNHCGRIESLELHKLHKHFLWEKEVSKAIIVPRHLSNLTKRNSRLHDLQPQNFVLFRFAGIFVQSKFGNQFPILPRISNAEPCMLVLPKPSKASLQGLLWSLKQKFCLDDFRIKGPQQKCCHPSVHVVLSSHLDRLPEASDLRATFLVK